MTIHIDKVRETLRRHATYLPGVLVDDLARNFVKDGLAHENDDVGEIHARAAQPMTFRELRRSAVLTAMQAAADPQKRVLINSVKAQARRLGYVIEDDKPIDVFALDQALKDKAVEDRFRLKEALYYLRMIPA